MPHGRRPDFPAHRDGGLIERRASAVNARVEAPPPSGLFPFPALFGAEQGIDDLHVLDGVLHPPKGLLAAAHDPAVNDLQRAIKAVFDPAGIMNPGCKIPVV